jgi:hypothetical protein
MIEPLLRIDEKLAELEWPVLEPLSQPQIEPRTLFIVACGFEERAVAFLKSALEQGCNNFRVLAIEYLPHYETNRKAELEYLCRTRNIDLSWIVYDRLEPEGVGQKILTNCSLEYQVLMDISGMSRLLIVQLLVVLGRRPMGFEGIQIIYAEAQEYPPSFDEFKADCDLAKQENGDPEPAFISWGVQALAVIPELTSPSMQGQATRLITFPSFNRTQLRQTVDELQPTRVDLIDGIPPCKDFIWRLQAIREWNAGVIATLPNLTNCQTSTLDYRETLRVLIGIYADYSVYEKLVIAPTGSKMQSVAVGLAVAFISDFQVVYPIPKKFSNPERHTLGVKQYYRLLIEKFTLASRHDSFERA